MRFVGRREDRNERGGSGEGLFYFILYKPKWTDANNRNVAWASGGMTSYERREKRRHSITHTNTDNPTDSNR